MRQKPRYRAVITRQAGRTPRTTTNRRASESALLFPKPVLRQVLRKIAVERSQAQQNLGTDGLPHEGNIAGRRVDGRHRGPRIAGYVVPAPRIG